MSEVTNVLKNEITCLTPENCEKYGFHYDGEHKAGGGIYIYRGVELWQQVWNRGVRFIVIDTKFTGINRTIEVNDFENEFAGKEKVDIALLRQQADKIADRLERIVKGEFSKKNLDDNLKYIAAQIELREKLLKETCIHVDSISVGSEDFGNLLMCLRQIAEDKKEIERDLERLRETQATLPLLPPKEQVQVEIDLEWYAASINITNLTDDVDVLTSIGK